MKIRGERACLGARTFPKKMYLWGANLSDIHVSLCNDSHGLLYSDY